MASFYETYAAYYMTIDMDEQGLFCSVPSERDINVKYTVRCDEHKDSVEVVSCNCPGYRRWGHCKHADICKAYWTKMYRSNQAKLAAKQEAEAKAAVAEAEKIVTSVTVESTTIQAIEFAKVEDLGTVGSLNGTAQSNVMPAWLAVLPSRQALAS